MKKVISVVHYLMCAAFLCVNIIACSSDDLENILDDKENKEEEAIDIDDDRSIISLGSKGKVTAVTQKMFSADNMIYLIEGECELNGASVTLPSNSLLFFKEGRIKNGKIEGNKAQIKGMLYNCFENITVTNLTVTDIQPEWFGAIADGMTDCTKAIDDAIVLLNSIGGNLVFSSGEYSTNGGHIINPGLKGAELKGSNSISQTSKIKHTGAGTIFWYNRNNKDGLSSGGGFSNLHFIGNSNTENGIMLSDRWGLYVRGCYFKDIIKGAAIHAFNHKSWTENVILENIYVRTTKFGVLFSMSSEEGATTSFYNSIIRNFAMSKTVGNDAVIKVHGVTCYGTSWSDIVYWDEANGGHNGILVRSDVHEGKLIGRVYIKADGDAGINSYEDSNVVNVGDNCYLDVVGEATIEQGGYLDLKNDNSRKFRRIVKQQTVWMSKLNSPLARFSGATVQAGGDDNVAASSILYDSYFLPPFSEYKVELRANNDSRIFIVRTNDINTIPFITEENASINSTLNLYGYEKGVAGSKHDNRGSRFYIYADKAFVGKWTVKITQM